MAIHTPTDLKGIRRGVKMEFDRTFGGTMAKPVPSLRSVPGVFTLACTVIGAAVLLGISVLVLTPLVLSIGVVILWLLACLLLAWLGIEAMAALERWFENDSRFQR